MTTVWISEDARSMEIEQPGVLLAHCQRIGDKWVVTSIIFW